MSRSLRALFVALSGLWFSGCAGVWEALQKEGCLPQRFYERGYNDGRAGKSMRTPGGCPDTAGFGPYREGYRQARAQEETRLARESLRIQPVQTSPATVQVVDASHAKSVVVVNPPPSAGASAPVNPQHPKVPADTLRAWEQRAWFCRLEAFGKSYAQWGSDRSTAQQRVIAACRERHAEMFCRDPTCEANSSPTSRGPEGFLCQVEAFGKKYQGKGGTSLEAREAARSACQEHRTANFCTEIDCAKEVQAPSR